MKVIFMGTPDFAVPTLESLIKSNCSEVVAVFTAGNSSGSYNNSSSVQLSPIHQYANKHNIPVHTTKILRSVEAIDLISSITADIIVVAAYGFLIPESILYAKKYGSINVHPSALPKYRGAAPIQHTVINGDTHTAICIIQMDKGLDTGDILLQRQIQLDSRITFKELHDKSALIGSQMVIEVISNIENIKKIPQSREGVSYAHKLSKDEGKINWYNSAYKIDCQVRGMNPWPGAYFKYNGKLIRILEADFNNNDHQIEPGTVVDNSLKIACGHGFLFIKKLQQSGKKALYVDEFLRGTQINKNVDLE